MGSNDGKKKLVRKASKVTDPLSFLNYSIPSSFTNESEKINFTFKWGTRLTDEEFDWVFGLFVENMRSLYEMSQWGFDPNSKKQELYATTSRYIIANIGNDKPIAYCHYRFDMDNGFAVVYCYEIQVEKEFQAHGLGTALIEILEAIGKKQVFSCRTLMDKVMATVFAFNEKSLGFFHKLGFVADVTCPDAEQDVDYLILSKPLKDTSKN
uniref:N-alpha-acetyltransferase 40 n=1 Tax=Syphacia muris TaxID=451379 RepID=A0A0N5A8E0_9BILA